MKNAPIPFACNMEAIAPDDRQKHLETIGSLFRSVVQVGDLPRGYSFALAQDDVPLNLAASFIDRERLCCPFFNFALRIEGSDRLLRLDITGPAGVKPFIIAELGSHLNPSVSFPGCE